MVDTAPYDVCRSDTNHVVAPSCKVVKTLQRLGSRRGWLGGMHRIGADALFSFHVIRETVSVPSVSVQVT